MSALETVDLDGVEILSVGGPVHGTGSAAEGDYWTADALREIAEANRALAGELKPAATIGHGSGDPAVGWLENVRINEDGSKLLADVKSVPRRFAELVKARAYRTRSVELSRVTSQRDGRRFEHVVTGLAWLGGRLPAVRTLADVVALYEHDGVTEQRSAGELVVDRAIFRGAVSAADRDVHLRAYEVAPGPAAALIEALPGDTATAYRNQALHLLGDADPEKRDLAERERIAREYGIPVEDVP